MLGFMPVTAWWARQGLNLRPHPCEGSQVMEMRGFPPESAGTESDSSENIAASSDQILTTVAALYVETGGCYFGVEGVDPWDIIRDARKYSGPHPVVAHSPCGPWGRYGASHPILGANYREAGQDDGCFEHVFTTLLTCGGVAEHPAHSKAWAAFGIAKPPHKGGWIQSGPFWTCHVEQGHYGHFSRKPTWLLYQGFGKRPPELIWGRSEQRLPAYAVERYGYEKARRIGVMAAVGGKHKTRIRNATPIPFRDLLLRLARGAVMGTVPMEEQVKADDAPGVANPCAERPDRRGSLPCAPNLGSPSSGGGV